MTQGPSSMAQAAANPAVPAAPRQASLAVPEGAAVATAVATTVAPGTAPGMAHPAPGGGGTAPAFPGGGAAARWVPPTWVWSLSSILLFFLAWEIAGRVPISPAFPPASKVLVALVELLMNGKLIAAYGNTLPPLLAGLAITTVVGLACGVAMGLSRLSNWALMPLMVIMQTAPTAAMIPLITFLYGIGFTAKVVSVVLLSMPVVAMNSYAGIHDTNASLLEMTRSFMGTRWQIVTKIILPHASGMIFAGLRLGISGGFIGIVLAELLITPTGIGDIISYYRSVARYAEMFAAILSIIVLATVVLTLLQVVERRIFTALGQRHPDK